MLRITRIVDDDVLNELRESIADSPKEFYNVVNRRVLPEAQARLEKRLNIDPGPAVHPFEFATPKSQHYYFATHEGAYQRTGGVRKWRVILKAFSGQSIELTFENPSPIARWVYGPRQIPGHKRTGWPEADPVLAQETERVIRDCAEVWVEILDKGAN
jgi:hypothetical protein